MTDYDPAKDAHDSYFAAVEAKRQRGDKHWPEPLKRAQSEHELQTSIIAYLDTVLPRTYRAVGVSNNPRSAIAGAKEKARGMRKGFPDLILIGPHGNCAFLEVKTGKGKLFSEQVEWGEWIVNNAGEYAVVRSIDDVRACLRAWNVPTREAE